MRFGWKTTIPSQDYDYLVNSRSSFMSIYTAIINVTQGTPNQIIIEGNRPFAATDARQAIDDAWKNIVEKVREAIESKLPHHPYHWQREWNHWANHAWEFFWY